MIIHGLAYEAEDISHASGRKYRAADGEKAELAPLRVPSDFAQAASALNVIDGVPLGLARTFNFYDFDELILCRFHHDAPFSP